MPLSPPIIRYCPSRDIIIHCNTWKECCFRPRFCNVRLYWAGDTLANKVNFAMNHAPGAGSIAQPADLQSSLLPLYHGRPPHCNTKRIHKIHTLKLRECSPKYHGASGLVVKIMIIHYNTKRIHKNTHWQIGFRNCGLKYIWGVGTVQFIKALDPVMLINGYGVQFSPHTASLCNNQIWQRS